MAESTRWQQHGKALARGPRLEFDDHISGSLGRLWERQNSSQQPTTALAQPTAPLLGPPPRLQAPIAVEMKPGVLAALACARVLQQRRAAAAVGAALHQVRGAWRSAP